MHDEAKCKMHEEWLKRIDGRTERIENALLGTLSEKGYITKNEDKHKFLENRILTLERFKKNIFAVFTWSATTILGTALIFYVTWVLSKTIF